MHRTVTEAALKHLWTINGADEATRSAVVRQSESRLVYRRQAEGLVDGESGGERAGTAGHRQQLTPAA